MRFWDSSAIVPLLAAEASSNALIQVFEDDPTIVVWWGTEVECTAALERKRREYAKLADALQEANERLDQLSSTWRDILPTPTVRQTARQLLRRYSLTAADALQLAAAIFASGRSTEDLPFVCLDQRLSEAAASEGFRVLPG